MNRDRARKLELAVSRLYIYTTFQRENRTGDISLSMSAEAEILMIRYEQSLILQIIKHQYDKREPLAHTRY